MAIVSFEQVVVRGLITFTVVVDGWTSTDSTSKVSIAVDGRATRDWLITVGNFHSDVAGHSALLASKYIQSFGRCPVALLLSQQILDALIAEPERVRHDARIIQPNTKLLAQDLDALAELCFGTGLLAEPLFHLFCRLFEIDQLLLFFIELLNLRGFVFQQSTNITTCADSFESVPQLITAVEQSNHLCLQVSTRLLELLGRVMVSLSFLDNLLNTRYASLPLDLIHDSLHLLWVIC